MASNIPAPSFTYPPASSSNPNPPRLTSHHSLPTARPPPRKPVLAGPGNSPSKTGVLTKRKPITPNGTSQQLPSTRQLPSKREPPPPRPVKGSGRGFVGTTIQPQLRKDSLDSFVIQPPSRAGLFEPTRTPSLVSGSSVSTADSPKSNIVRRRGSFSRNGQRASPDSASSQEDPKARDPLVLPYEDHYPDAVFGISLPPSQSILASKDADAVIDLDRFMNQPPFGQSIITHDLPPPTPQYSQYSQSVASSTRSPGLFSVSSTPTSTTCYSPSTISNGTRPSLSLPRQPSPTKRPSNTRLLGSGNKNATDPTPARQNSSSSGSTVRAGELEARQLRSPSATRDSPSRNRLTRPKPRLESPVKERRPSAVEKMSRSTTAKHPEFAHLANASPLKRNVSQLPPVRPSRDGTPDMNLKEPLPTIIHSNMSSLPPSFHNRQNSSESRKGPTGALQPVDAKSRFGIPRKAPSRNPSPSPTAAPTTQPIARGLTPEIASDSERTTKLQASPNPERSQSRFGFFKRGKPEPQQPPPSKDKRLRKGPAAGTGHEGYGKFGARGRSGSTTSGNTSIGRSSSADSGRGNVTLPSSRKNSVGSKTSSDVDEFLADRLSPITLRGTGNGNHTERKGSGNADESHGSYDVVNHHTERSAPPPAVDGGESPRTLLPSPIADSHIDPPTAAVSQGGAIDVNEQRNHRFGIPSLSAKRVSRRSMVDGRSVTAVQEDIFQDFRFPAHPAIHPLERQLSESSQSTMSTTAAPAPVIGQRGQPPPKAAPKLTRKWNFLWANKPNKKDEKVAEPRIVDVTRHAPPRSVAHYALMDAAPGQVDLLELEKIMQEAETVTEKSPLSEEVLEAEPQITRHGNSMLLPEPPRFVPDFALPPRPASPKVTLQVPQSAIEYDIIQQQQIDAQEPAITLAEPEVPTARPSRLPQVGRIPRVVSKRDRDRKPSTASFSRPFGSTQPSPAMQSPQFLDNTPNGSMSNLYAGSEFLGVNGGLAAPILPTTTAFTASPESINDAMAPPFMSYPRKNSEVSVTSSSSGRYALPAPITIPSPRAPSEFDEVWGEYDDLLDLLSSQPPKTPHTGSSFGAPFHYAELASPVEGGPVRVSHGPPQDVPVPSVPDILRRIRFPSLRESLALSASNFAPSPTSPVSVVDFLSQHGDRTSGALGSLSGRVSLPSTTRWSSGTSRISTQPPVKEDPREDSQLPSNTLAVQPPENVKRDSVNIQLVEAQHMGFESMANLRFSALMTSKWLSFGRVLFSPAHFEMKDTKEDRVLVLDGLGKDWSFYVALNYSNAMIYNLGPDPVEESNTSKNPSIGSQPNHRHIHHPNLLAHFPFPKGFFTAVVFRFPGLASETAYRFALGECKRVLRPGGHLEVSVLDMDMLNMGNLGRRALRSLKEKITADDPSLSLKPVSNTIQRLLGRRGFENLNRCFVGIPASGCIPSSKEGSSNQTPLSGSPVKSTFGAQNMPPITDLMREQSGSSDDGITQTAARVARWWYSRCYESHVLASGEMDQSIWADEALLKECEKRGTSLRLMVCFAQKPDCPVRRTISV